LLLLLVNEAIFMLKVAPSEYYGPPSYVLLAFWLYIWGLFSLSALGLDSSSHQQPVVQAVGFVGALALLIATWMMSVW
jgi:hypothetical protein